MDIALLDIYLPVLDILPIGYFTCCQLFTVMPRHKQRVNYAVYGKTGVLVKEKVQKETDVSGERPPSQARPDDSKLGAAGGAEPLDPIYFGLSFE